MIMAGTRASGPALERRIGPDQRRTGQRLHGRGGDDKVGHRLRHRVDGFGRALIGLDVARTDGGEHGPHQRQHRPAIFDDGDGERVEMTAKGAMVEHRTLNPGPRVAMLSVTAAT
jgi:hypothetical protein